MAVCGDFCIGLGTPLQDLGPVYNLCVMTCICSGIQLRRIANQAGMYVPFDID